MERIYLVISLAVMLSAMATGFITFRMAGMRLAPHFICLILALLTTLAAIVTMNGMVIYAAVMLQALAALTAYSQTFATLRYNFQTSPGYAPHIALVTMLPVFAIATLMF